MADERDEDRDPQVYATTRHGRLSLDEIGGMMPGLGSLMPVIADRFGWMVHAARGGNWKLARYQLRKVRKLLALGGRTRPKWTDTIDAYDTAFLAPVFDAIKARGLDRFETTVAAAVDEANRIHGEIGYGYILYRVPDEPPAHFELGPVEEDGED